MTTEAFDPYAHDAAPYVLGALSPEDRHRFEAHLAECGRCAAEVRELAGLPGLLSRLPASEVAGIELESEPPPQTMLPILLTRAGRERRASRWRVGLTAVAAALVAAVGGAVVTSQINGAGPNAPAGATTQALALTPLNGTPVEATVRIQPTAWGSQITMDCTFTGAADGAPKSWHLVAYDKNRKPYTSGDWQVLPGKDVQAMLATSLAPDQIARLEVVNAKNVPVLRLDR